MARRLALHAGWIIVLVACLISSGCTSPQNAQVPVQSTVPALTPAQSPIQNPVPTPETPITTSATAAAQTSIAVPAGTPANQLVQVTLNSAEKRAKVGSFNAKPGEIFLVLSITVQNSDPNEDFVYGPRSFGIYDKTNQVQVLPTKMTSGLDNPFTSGMVPMKSGKTGQVAFPVSDTSNSYTFTVLNSKGIVVASFDNIVVT